MAAKACNECFFSDPINYSLAKTLGYRKGPLKHVSIAENRHFVEVCASLPENPAALYSFPSYRLKSDWISRPSPIKMAIPVLSCQGGCTEGLLLGDGLNFVLWYPESDSVQAIPVTLERGAIAAMIVSYQSGTPMEKLEHSLHFICLTETGWLYDLPLGEPSVSCTVSRLDLCCPSKVSFVRMATDRIVLFILEDRKPKLIELSPTRPPIILPDFEFPSDFDDIILSPSSMKASASNHTDAEDLFFFLITANAVNMTTLNIADMRLSSTAEISTLASIKQCLVISNVLLYCLIV